MAVKSTTGQGSTSSTSNVDALTTCAYILSSYTVTIVNTPNIWQGIQKLWYTLKKEKKKGPENIKSRYRETWRWERRQIISIFRRLTLDYHPTYCVYLPSPPFIFFRVCVYICRHTILFVCFSNEPTTRWILFWKSKGLYRKEKKSSLYVVYSIMWTSSSHNTSGTKWTGVPPVPHSKRPRSPCPSLAACGCKQSTNNYTHSTHTPRLTI